MTLTKEEIETICLTDGTPIYRVNDNPPGDITFCVSGPTEVLRLCANGDFMVKGRVVVNDMEVYEAFKEFLAGVR